MLAELDLSNHYHLITNYPSTSTEVGSESTLVQEVDEDTTVSAEELTRKLGGEEFDSDSDEEDDHTAPTEKQKREIFKIQIKNALNANRYVNDPLMHVEKEEFSIYDANEIFLSSDILKGFSVGEIMY